MSNPTRRLGELQLAILRVLWDRGEATVAEVHESLLAQRNLAQTTIATMLTKMEKRGLVVHRTEQRRFVYSSLVGEQDVHRTLVRDLVERVFQGDASALVHHLLAEGEIEAGELDELRQLIDRAEGGSRG
jgi:predicted transcriptional regulator